MEDIFYKFNKLHFKLQSFDRYMFKACINIKYVGKCISYNLNLQKKF